VDLIDRDFTSVNSLSILGNAGINFTSFTAFVQDPVSDLPQDGDAADYGVFTPGNIPAGGTSIGMTVRRYHPVTMQLLGTVLLPENHRAIAVDANGDVFAVNPKIHHYDRYGALKSLPMEAGPVAPLSDIDIDGDGRLLIAAQDGHMLTTDRDFTSLYRFLTQPTEGKTFATFVGLSRGSLKANWDAFEVDEDSVDSLLDVRVNDRLNGLGAIMITDVGATSHGGTVSIAGNTQLSYTPALDFVGVETFTYTISNGLPAPDDATDVALVQVTVNGVANYFTVDDGYQTTEDMPLAVTPAGVLRNDGRPDIFDGITPGNFLVTHSPVGVGSKALLQEYTRQGQLVRSIPLPDFSEGKLGERARCGSGSFREGADLQRYE
jgi:hypothetical protein